MLIFNFSINNSMFLLNIVRGEMFSETIFKGLSIGLSSSIIL